MKIVIVGCGRVGSSLAENLDAAGHDVTIFDIKTSAFDRLPDTFKGAAIRGDGTDEEVLRRAGALGADIFLALTEGDNRNVMAAQVATENLGVPRVIAKINDPVRATAYAELGVATLCRTNLMLDSIADYLDLPIEIGPGIDIPETPGSEHPHPSAAPAPIETEVGRRAHAPTNGATADAAGSSPSKETSAADAARKRNLGLRRWRS